ncbi:MAG: type II secretion system protein [Candidatus Omnitrophota bacterium]
MGKKGFTLVELMVSVVILGFGLSIVIQSYMSALAGLDTSRNMVESMFFAQKKIEELTADSYKNNGSLPESDSGVVKLGERFFNWKTEISGIEEPEYLSGNFVAAEVSVDWKERSVDKNTALAIFLPRRKSADE